MQDFGWCERSQVQQGGKSARRHAQKLGAVSAVKDDNKRDIRVIHVGRPAFSPKNNTVRHKGNQALNRDGGPGP